MTAQQIIALAQNGELQQLAIKDNVEAVVGFINLGLIELYKRFNLRTEEYLLELIDGVTIYTMPSDYMYMITAYEEVTEDASLNTTSVVPINEEDNIFSVNTISFNQIQVPLTLTGAYISIIYSALPVQVASNNLAAEVALPEQLIDPLLHYIGYRGHGSIDGKIDAESNSHLMRFEASCNKVKELGVGMTADDMSMSNRIYDRGFA